MNSKQATASGNLFEISFLILFYVIHEHGQEIVLNLLEEDCINLNSTCSRSVMEIDEQPIEQQHELTNSFKKVRVFA